MSNINFNNPWLLFLAIPLLALVIVPFVFAVKKQNRNIHNVISLVCHILIVVFMCLVFAGMRYDDTITQTNVYILADVSYSSNNNLEVIDGCVDNIVQSTPKNSKVSLIAFGRNCQVLSDFDQKIVSVKSATEVDFSATDISGALRFVSNLLDENVINRIVVITDGNQNIGNNKLASMVNSLQEDGVYIDAVYLDNTLQENVNELQISSVTFTSNTFLGKKENAELTLNSNNTLPTNIFIDVECNGEKSSVTRVLYKGQNLISVPLQTTAVGKYTYKISIRQERPEMDTSPYNNSCIFEQNVINDSKVLFVGGNAIDLLAGQKIYSTTNVDYISDPKKVPYTIEELCKYDQIVLCNFDIRKMSNCNQFVNSLDMVVSKFGKSLTTYGNTYIQELILENNEALENLRGLLPVTIGNPNQNERLVTFVLDISTSMNFVSRLQIAKLAAAKILSNLTENDTVLIVGYSGDLKILNPTSKLLNKQDLLDIIANYEPRNGTMLLPAMQYAYNEITSRNFHLREMIILSDGLASESTAELVDLAQTISASNVVISALSVYPPAIGSEKLRNIVYNPQANGKGYYKEIKSENDVDLILQDISEDMIDVKIQDGSFEVKITRPQELILENVNSFVNVKGFWYNTIKSSATTVITAKWQRDRLTSFDVPIYAYWSYGNGKVSSFMSDISANSNWTSNWVGESENNFWLNVQGATLPDEHIATPFLFETSSFGNTTHIAVATSKFQNSATASIDLQYPDGKVISAPLVFDSERYVADFETPQVGLYKIHLVYDYLNNHYDEYSTFSIDYLQEYNAFDDFAYASMYKIITANGEISRDGVLKMDNSDSDTRVYTLSFTVPFLIVCVALFVVDVINRKLRWKDILTFVNRIKRKGGGQA